MSVVGAMEGEYDGIIKPERTESTASYGITSTCEANVWLSATHNVYPKLNGETRPVEGLQGDPKPSLGTAVDEAELR